MARLQLIKNSVCVVGLGYVGLPLAILARRKGCHAIGIDIDETKVNLINHTLVPFKNETLAQKLKRHPVRATTNFAECSSCETVIVCVPTPVYANRLPNLEPLIRAVSSIACNLIKGQLIILESTVYPGVSEEVVIPILEKKSGLKCSRDFYFAHCPERINPGDEKWSVENISRVIGASDPRSLKLAMDFYGKVLAGSVKPMGLIREAEAVKVVENSFRDINIAFVNELARSFHKLGIDVINVIEGASTKPFSFQAHFPGCGVGGHCIPVDPYYLIDYAKKNHFKHDFLSLARKINDSMPDFAVELLLEAFKEARISIKGAQITLLGISYKPNVDDCRESPSFKILAGLKKAGFKVVAYDPYVKHSSDARSLHSALDGAKAIVVATAHNQFRKLTAKLLKECGVKIVVDGRNCLNKASFKKSGLIYKGIGR